MKAIVNVGDGKGQVDNKIGHPMEIIPLKNPADLRSGDYLPVKVLCHGKPYNRIMDIFMPHMPGFQLKRGRLPIQQKPIKKEMAKSGYCNQVSG